MYFVHVDQNLMDSNPKYATTRSCSLIKDVRIVINPFFEAKMRPTPELSTSDVMRSVHRDSV